MLTTKTSPLYSVHVHVGLKWQISLPFHVPQLAKSLPFCTPEAWNRHSFWVEPPCIELSRIPPSPLRCMCVPGKQDLVHRSCSWSYNLGQTKWKIKTTPPTISVGENMACFGFSACSSLTWGEGLLLFLILLWPGLYVSMSSSIIWNDLPFCNFDKPNAGKVFILARNLWASRFYRV